MTEEPPQEVSSKQPIAIFLVASMVIAVVTQIASFYLVPPGQMDDADYVLRAMKFARPEQFTLLHNPTHFSSGWPLVLMPFYKLTDQYYFIGRVVSVAFTTLTAPLLFSIFQKRSHNAYISLALVALFLNSTQVLRLGSSLMSESLYFFLVCLCLWGGSGVKKPWLLALVGMAASWNVTVRMEALSVAIAVVAGLLLHKKWRAMAAFFGGTLLGTVLARLLVPNDSEKVHVGAAFNAFEGQSVSQLLKYPFVYLQNTALHTFDAVFGYFHKGSLVFWTVVLLLLAVQLKANFSLKNHSSWSDDATIWWLLLFPIIISPWPFFTARYWPLWTVLFLGYLVSSLPTKGRIVAVVLLLALQLPSVVREYRLNIDAKLFTQKIYLPYYQSLSKANRVMSLHSSRVETIAFNPTAEPIQRTEFQSIPIAMAYFECDIVEWEVNKRDLVSYTGQDVRPYPPNALECLRNSTIFEPFASCAFSESFRLTADPAKLKAVGALFSQAMQTQDLTVRLNLLDQALALVSDLPETRIHRAQTALAINPDDVAAKAELEKVYQQYPSYQSL